MTRLTPDAESALVATITTIMREHVGADRAIGRGAMLAELRRFEPLLGDRTMRRLIETHLPHICFSTRGKGGYFLARDAKEARAVAQVMEHYIRGIAARRAAIIRANPEAGQLELGL